VQLRASGAFTGGSAPRVAMATELQLAQAVDPVCGMTVMPGASGLPLEHDARTYYFCCAGCRRTFEKDPDAYIKAVLK
jgi:xanthine dehydrogenase accessory factor